MSVHPSAALAALRLYGSLLDRDPPPGFSEEQWDRLIAASWHLYLVAALHQRRAPRGAADLAELTRATRDCMDLLEGPGVAGPVARAWMCLRLMLDELDAEASLAGAPLT